MSRTLSTGMAAAVTASQLNPILLADLDFSTPVRLWSGYGTITVGSTTYLGVGTLGTISEMDETTDLSARGVRLQLSGIPSEYVSLALTENYQGRTCSIAFGALDNSAGVVGTPVTVFGGRMDVMSIDDDGQTATITLTAENRLIDLNRAREVRYTHEEQQTRYPGDLGLQYVTGIQDKVLYWGNPNVPAKWDTGRYDPEPADEYDY